MTTETKKILISSRSFGKISSGAIELLEDTGLTPILNPHGKKLSEDELIIMVNDVVGIIAGTENITKNVMLHADALKVISRYGVGLDNVDMKTAEEKNILVYRTPETPALAVAELTLSLILNLLRKISKVDGNIKANLWKSEVGNLLTEKTVGIIGLGRIGKKLVEFLQPFEVNVLVYETKPDKTFTSKYGIKLTSFEELICDSDIITLHCPLTERTKLLIGSDELSKMKDTAILINTARGGLVDEEALYEALKNGKISGAAIDAFETEPYTGPLKKLDNVILTPHVGSLTVETRKHMEIEAAENIINGLKKQNVL